MGPEISPELWEGYMGDDVSWWIFHEEADTYGHQWWMMASRDGVEACSIPMYHDRTWGQKDSELIGQLVKMFARRRIVYHGMGIVTDPLLDQSEDGLTYWQGLLEMEEEIAEDCAPPLDVGDTGESVRTEVTRDSVLLEEEGSGQLSAELRPYRMDFAELANAGQVYQEGGCGSPNCRDEECAGEDLSAEARHCDSRGIKENKK
jgi:hypothetical protein